MTDRVADAPACPAIGSKGGQCDLKPGHRGSHAALSTRESWPNDADAIPKSAAFQEGITKTPESFEITGAESFDATGPATRNRVRITGEKGDIGTFDPESDWGGPGT